MRRLHPAVPAVSMTLLLILATGPTAEARSDQESWQESGRVVRVLDGDTFDMAVDAGTVRVRINGIQAPETTWCGGAEGRKALQDIIPPGSEVRLAAVKQESGNSPYGVWRLKRTVHAKVDGEWVDVAPELLSRGTVFPFPFVGEDAHNDEYLSRGWQAHEQRVGLYDPALCGPVEGADQRVELEVVADGPGRDSPDSEFVMVFNGSEGDIDLDGWMVQDTSPLNAFFFPPGSAVRADDYVVVFSGSGTHGIATDGSRDDRYFYAATGMRWNNETSEIAFLFDDTGDDRTGNLRDWLMLTPGS